MIAEDDKIYFVFEAKEGWEQLSYPMTLKAAQSYIRSRRLHNRDEKTYCIMQKLTEKQVSA